jgi:hypothetical protein
MTPLRTGMPLLCSNEGIWEGTYSYLTPDNQVVDQHRSLLVCRVLDDDAEHPYRQTNITLWPDGRVWRMEYPARYRDGRIHFDDALIAGHFAELPDGLLRRTIVGTWRWKKPEQWLQRPCGDVEMFEMIQNSRDGRHRSRTWHWIEDGAVILRTLVQETHTSRHWRSWDAANPPGPIQLTPPMPRA